jgi:hypothetical protein
MQCMYLREIEISYTYWHVLLYNVLLKAITFTELAYA